MLRRGLIVMLGALLLTAGGTAAAARPHARVWLSSRRPVTVHGSHFHRRERVRVVLRAGLTKVVRHVRASRTGRFTVTFAAVVRGPCGRISVVATGRRGSRAILAGMAQPDCIAD
ncbi:MAG TPA: hypothetical protein VH418_21260 [Solirubrobacteraceae bacterium]|jgi:hypothetical protein